MEQFAQPIASPPEFKVNDVLVDMTPDVTVALGVLTRVSA